MIENIKELFSLEPNYFDRSFETLKKKPDALKELTIKLSEHGLTLKVCQACKYFQPVVDGSTNMIKGCCNCQFQGRTPGDMIPTLIWNTCPRFEEQNVVNLF